MIGNKLFLISLGHGAKRVVLTSELTSELAEGLLSVLLDLVSLVLADAGTKGELGQVTANTDAGRLDHGGVFLSERWAVQLGVVHVGDVLGVLGVTVVLKDHGVEQGAELGVALVGASVATNAGIGVLATGEDAHLE